LNETSQVHHAARRHGGRAAARGAGAVGRRDARIGVLIGYAEDDLETKVRRLMREFGLQPKRRKRFVATTDSDHDGPIFPDLVRDRMVDGPNQVWVADITYIAIATGFVYMAAILDAWSRRIVGYVISRSMDARLAVAVPKAAVRPADHRTAAFTTRTAARNMRLRSSGAYLRSMVSSARWVDAGTPTTMPRPRAL
jgi:transposase InsO family protein